MALIGPNWPLRMVCCAALLLWMPERSAGDVGSRKAGDTASLRAAVACDQGCLAADE